MVLAVLVSSPADGNIDPRESLLDRVSLDEFRELLNLDPVSPQQAAAGLQLPQDVSRPDEFWSALMWALLFVLILETLLASRIHA